MPALNQLSAAEKSRLRERIAEVLAIVIAAAYTRGTLDAPAVTSKREDYYRAADEILALIPPRGKE